jgi:putative ABC transport system permease protein
VEVPGSQVRDTRPVLMHQVNADYLRLASIPILAGRAFSEGEIGARSPVALVNQAFVTRYLNGRDPIGTTFRAPRLRLPPVGLAEDSFQIIGIVRDTPNRAMTDEIWPEFYLPYTLLGYADRLIVHTAQEPYSVLRAIREQVYAVDKDQPVMDVRTVSQFMHEFVLSGPRFNLFLLGVFASLGLVLAAIGVYGVISNHVARQTREIGVRVALGAESAQILSMVVSRGARLIGAGVGIGLLASAWLTQFLERQVFRVSRFDAVAFGGAALLLAAIGLLACWWPARRASRVDPVAALRLE